MIVLVDWENVCGIVGCLDGIEYLDTHDKVELFYSENCDHLKNKDFNNLKKSTCTFGITKLKASRKNALDFYICCKLGIYLQEYDFKDLNIGILSKDTGFDSCIDFVSCLSNRNNVKVRRCSSLIELLLCFKEESKAYILKDLQTYNETTSLVEVEKNYNKVLKDKLSKREKLYSALEEYGNMKHLLNGRDLKEIIDNTDTANNLLLSKFFEFIKEYDVETQNKDKNLGFNNDRDISTVDKHNLETKQEVSYYDDSFMKQEDDCSDDSFIGQDDDCYDDAFMKQEDDCSDDLVMEQEEDCSDESFMGQEDDCSDDSDPFIDKEMYYRMKMLNRV